MKVVEHYRRHRAAFVAARDYVREAYDAYKDHSRKLLRDIGTLGEGAICVTTNNLSESIATLERGVSFAKSDRIPYVYSDGWCASPWEVEELKEKASADKRVKPRSDDDSA